MKKWRLLVATSAFALGMGCASAQITGVSDKEIRFGSFTDLSGPLATWGVTATNGIKMRFEEANQAGGVHGRKLNLLVEDTQYQVPLAIKAANKLMNDGVFAFIANLGTPPNNATMPRLIAAGIPNVFPLASSLSMYEPTHPLKIAYLMSYREQGAAMIRYVHDKLKVKTLCYQVQANDYGEESVDGWNKAAKELGLVVKKEGQHKSTETEFTAAVASLKNSGCEVLLLAATPRDATQIYTAARAAGWNVPIIANQAPLVSQVSDNPVMDGFLVAAPFAAVDFNKAIKTSPKVKAWYDQYKKQFNSEPSAQSLIGYAMADLTVKALEITGAKLTTEAFMKSFLTINNYQDIFGGPTISFSSTKRYGNDYMVLHKVQNREWVIVEPKLPF